MATGGRLRPLQTGSMASLFAGISEMTARVGQAQGAGYAALGRGLGGGIAQAGENIRTAKRRAEDKAEREQERAAARADREAARAESRAERDENRAFQREERRAERAYENQMLTLHQQIEKRHMDEAQAKHVAKKAEEAAAEASEIAGIQALAGDQTPPEVVERGAAAQTQAQTLAQAAEGMFRRIFKAGPAPSVMSQAPDGSIVDETDPETMFRIKMSKYQDVLSKIGNKSKSVSAAATGAEKVLRHQLGSLGASIQAKKAAEKDREVRTKTLAEQQAQNEAVRLARQAVVATAREIGMDPGEAMRYVQADVLAGADPNVIRSALVGRVRTETIAAKPEPTPVQEGVDRGTTNFTAAEEERRLRLGLPEAERRQRFKEEYRRRAASARDDADLEALREAIAEAWGL